MLMMSSQYVGVIFCARETCPESGLLSPLPAVLGGGLLATAGF